MKNQSSSMAQKPSSWQFRKLFVWKAMLSVILLLTLSFIGVQGHAQAAADTHLNALYCSYYTMNIPFSGITLRSPTYGYTFELTPVNSEVQVLNETTSEEGQYTLPYTIEMSGVPEIRVYYDFYSPSGEAFTACAGWYWS
jgi:hypothetical protein